MPLAFRALAVGAGVELLARKERGRILSIVHSVLSLFNIPFGAIIGALALMHLLRSRTGEYFASASEQLGSSPLAVVECAPPQRGVRAYLTPFKPIPQ